MDILISNYLRAIEKASVLRSIARIIEDEAEEIAENATIPSVLRPATPDDIIKGAVIWYPDENDDDVSWHIIEEVLNPKCDFKAYVAMCGARYGLDNAYVENA
jgi:hypothetical protein